MFWFLAILCLAPLIQCSEILVVAPFPARSHFFLLEPLARELSERGHQVTFITAVKVKNPPTKNFNEIFVNVEIAFTKEGKDRPNFLQMRSMGPFSSVTFLPFLGLDVCDTVLSNKVVSELMNSGKKYDVIIGEAFLTESLLGVLTVKFKAPLIAFGTFMPSFWVNFLVGNEAPTSYIPDPFTMLPTPMTFFQRVYQFVFSVFANAYHFSYYMNAQNGILKRYLGDDSPHVMSILKNTSLLLVNDHFATSFPRPTVPNLISIAGLHVKPPKPLPEDIKKYMDESKNGVILFSMGSNLRSTDIDPKIRDVILKVFSRLKENVLWKFEADLPNKPSNVFISDWLPQSDILAHPNLKLFITHGGLLSTTESIDRGVPLIGIPIFGDQPMNMKQSENAGVGLTVQYDEISEELFYNSIQEVLTNPKYTKAAKSRSRIFKDMPQTPMERAIFWVEYVIRHKGASHLRSAAQDLTWYQHQQLDVLAVLGAFVVTVILIAKCLIKKIWSLVCGKPKVNENKKKKNLKKE